MTDALAPLVAELEAAARAAWREEEALRARMAQEIARLERRRAFAHRRVYMVRLLASAAASAGADDAADAEAAAAAAQRAAMRRELGWSTENDFRRAVLDRLRVVGIAIWRCAQGEEGASPSSVQAEIDAFESWYDAAHGQPFYSLLDQEPAEVNLVET